MFVYGNELNNTLDPVRAGVIPFTVRDNHIYFLLGIDRRTRELTDFGGGVKSTETMVEGALREFYEESCKIFGDIITKSDLEKSMAVTNATRDTAIIFLHVNSSWIDIAETKFKRSQQELSNIKKHNELIGIKWVVDQYFRLIAFNRRSQCMWRRIQNMLCSHTTWDELRLILILGPELTNAVKNSWYYLKGIGSPSSMA